MWVFKLTCLGHNGRDFGNLRPILGECFILNFVVIGGGPLVMISPFTRVDLSFKYGDEGVLA